MKLLFEILTLADMSYDLIPPGCKKLPLDISILAVKEYFLSM